MNYQFKSWIFSIDDQRACKQATTTRKEDIEALLAQISGVNGDNRRLYTQRVSLAEINDTQLHQSQSDSNLERLKKDKKKKVGIRSGFCLIKILF